MRYEKTKKTIRISRPPENLIKICDISYVRFQSNETPISRSMKKGMLPLRIIFVVVLSQNEVHLGYFAGITMKKTTYLLRSTTCLYVSYAFNKLV